MLKLDIGTIVRIVRAGENSFWRITGREPFWYETASEFSALATAASSEYTEIENLEPQKTVKRLMYILMGLNDGLQYYVQYQMGTERWGVDKDRDSGYLTSEISHKAAMNEDYAIWLMSQDTIAIKATNNTGYTMTPKVFFQGMKYDIVEVVDLEVLQSLMKEQLPYFWVPRGIREAGA